MKSLNIWEIKDGYWAVLLAVCVRQFGVRKPVSGSAWSEYWRWLSAIQIDISYRVNQQHLYKDTLLHSSQEQIFADHKIMKITFHEIYNTVVKSLIVVV